MTCTAADILIDSLEDWGVEVVFGLPGDGINGIMDALRQRQDKVRDVAIYNTRVMGPAHAENVVNLACRTALGYRGVAHINFPVDLQDQVVGERSKRNVANHTSDVLAHRARLPAEDGIVRAAEVLNAGKKIAILCGQGALKCYRRAGRGCRKIRRTDHQGVAR